MEEQNFPSRSDRHKHEKIKKEKPKKADKSGVFFKRETEDLELTIGRDKTGRTLDDAWYMKAEKPDLDMLSDKKTKKKRKKIYNHCAGDLSFRTQKAQNNLRFCCYGY